MPERYKSFEEDKYEVAPASVMNQASDVDVDEKGMISIEGEDLIDFSPVNDEDDMTPKAPPKPTIVRLNKAVPDVKSKAWWND